MSMGSESGSGLLESQVLVSLLDGLPDASVMVFDRDFRFLLVRGGALTRNGISPAELEGRTAPEALPPARWAFYQELYEGAIAGRSGSVDVASPGGDLRYHVSVNPVLDAGGVVVGGIALATDVTEIGRLADAVADAERRYRLAMLSSGVGTALVDADGCFAEVNDALCSSLGYPAGDLVGLPFTDISHPDHREQGMALFEDLKSGRRDVFRVRKRHLHADGHVVWSDVTGSALRRDDGDFLGAIEQIVDVTSEVARVEQLAASERRYRMLAENSGDVVFHQVAGVIRWISPSVVQLLGWSADDLTGAETLDLWHPDDREMVRAVRDSVYAGHHGQAVLRFRRKDGSYIRLECVLRPVSEHGQAGIVGVLRDVTARQEAEAALRAAEERYRLVAENASDVVLLVGADDRISWVSPSGEALFGWKERDVVGHRGVEFIHPEDLPTAGAAMMQTRSGSARDDEYRIRRADGRFVWVSVRSSPILDDAGAFGGRVAALRDVDAAVAARIQLAASEERFRLAMENSAAGMVLASRTGDFLLVNPAVCQFLGRTEAELLELGWPDVTHPDEVEADRQLLGAILAGHSEHFRREKRYLRADGEIVWGDLAVAAVRDAAGDVDYIVGQIIDITGRVEAEQARTEHEQLLRVVLDKSPDATVRFDPQLRIEYANEQFESLCGLCAEDVRGRTLAEIGFPDGQPVQWETSLAQVVRRGEPSDFEFALGAAPAQAYLETRLAPEVDQQGAVAHVIATIRDITRRRGAEIELQRMATHDPLTGLANRTVIMDEITRALSSSQRTGRLTAVLMLDLDRFKTVNDTLGHTIGDALLLQAADRLAKATRGGDLVGRQGGDEFVIVMRDLETASEALNAAARIVEDFRAPFVVEGRELFATVSVGIAIDGTSGSAGDALRDADTAMFVSKSSGRDKVTVYNDDLRTAVSERLAMETELRHAIERNRLEVWYQPEVDLTTGGVIAAEALLRWRDPAGSVSTAESFITVAEDTGLIVEIGRWVLTEACTQAATWDPGHVGRPVTLRVNVSAVQLLEAGLIADLDDALKSSGLDPHSLCIEITETALLRESPTVQRNLDLVRARGVSVALDDFGTGYGSLAYLRKYPVDIVKIDKSFVDNIVTDPQDRHLVQGVIALAAALGMSVTGEGVETLQQAQCLRDLGCPGAQGYLFSRAVEPGSIRDVIATRYDVA